MVERPNFIRHYTEIEEPVGDGDLRAQAARFGKALGLTRLGINLEIISPGCRSSWPHEHSLDEEFVFVLEGNFDVWIDGHLHRLRPGDGVAFPAGTGITHTFINNTDAEIRLLIVGERNPDDRTIYPLDPDRLPASRVWHEAPRRPLGPHHGTADRRR
jgi:uncharacterized cupin superfamily protein